MTQMEISKLLKAQDSELAAFSDNLWLELLDYATVYVDGKITFTLKKWSNVDG